MITLPEKGLYAITDCEHLDTDILIRKSEEILDAGAVMLQYRNKSDDYELKQIQAELLQKLCDKYHVPFIINDDIELARKLGADGVHLGVDDTGCKKARIILGPDSIIGISCYNDLDRAIIIKNAGASYIAFGAFFPSQTKVNTVKADLKLIKIAKEKLNLPIVAIGGITTENGNSLIQAGADFLAVISGIYNPENTASITRDYVKLFNHER